MTHDLRIVSTCLLFLAPTFCHFAPAAADEPSPRQAARDDLKKLQGTWQCIAMERHGEDVPAESLKGSTATYEDDRITLTRNGQPYRRGIVSLDPSRTPKATNTWDLDGPDADGTVPGIYQFEGETLKVCFSQSGGDRPTEFTTKRGPGTITCTYQRKKP